MDFESAARELKLLARKESLTPSELERVKELMVLLKGLGMTNAEISELTEKRWGVSTIKGYTRGVRATDPGPWRSTTALFSEMQARNLTLDDVTEAITTSEEIEAMGSSLADVANFMADLKEKETNLAQLNEAWDVKTELEQAGTSPREMAGFMKQLKAENIDVPAFVSLFRDWHKTGLTPSDAQSALSYKTRLEQAGLDIDTASLIAEAAEKFDNPREVFQAIEKYGTLVKLDEEIQTKQKELESLSKAAESLTQKTTAADRRLEAVEKKRAAIDKDLATYKRLQAKGFDEKTLQAIAEVVDKYGDRDKVLAALNAFGNLSEIEAASQEMRTKLQLEGIALEEMETKESHLRTATEMCRALLFEHEFSLDLIMAILTLAKVYGDPIKVLEAVESYGKRQALDEKARQLEARIEQLKKTESQYESRNKAILDQFESLNAKAIEVGRTVGSIEEQLKQSTRARDILNLLQNPTAAGYDEYAPLVLLLVWSIKVWVNENKSRFSFSYRINEGLDALAKNLGGS